MERQNDDGEGFANLSPDSDKHKRIQLLLASANFERLKARAIESRKQHQPKLPSNVECDINSSHFTSGFNNVVLELTFSDNVCWIARIPYQDFDDGDRISILSEIATMQMIHINTTFPIPHVFEFEASADQPFGYPYVIMEYISGRILPNGLAASINLQHRVKVAQQLANIFSELQKLTFSRIGRLWCGENVDQPVKIVAMAWHSSPGPPETSLEYFYNQQQSENREILSMHPDDPYWLTACWVLKTALTHFIIDDRVRGPSPLCYLDLHVAIYFLTMSTIWLGFLTGVMRKQVLASSYQSARNYQMRKTSLLSSSRNLWWSR